MSKHRITSDNGYLFRKNGVAKKQAREKATEVQNVKNPRRMINLGKKLDAMKKSQKSGKAINQRGKRERTMTLILTRTMNRRCNHVRSNQEQRQSRVARALAVARDLANQIRRRPAQRRIMSWGRHRKSQKKGSRRIRRRWNEKSRVRNRAGEWGSAA